MPLRNRLQTGTCVIIPLCLPISHSHRHTLVVTEVRTVRWWWITPSLHCPEVPEGFFPHTIKRWQTEEKTRSFYLCSISWLCAFGQVNHVTWSSRERRFAWYIVWKEALSLHGCDHWRGFLIQEMWQRGRRSGEVAECAKWVSLWQHDTGDCTLHYKCY